MLGLLLLAVMGAAAPDWSSLADLQGRPVAPPSGPSVVVVVAARRARELRAWEERLRRLEPPPELLRVVDVPPGGRADEIGRELRRRVPAGVKVALDARRAVAAALGLDTSRANVLVLDREARVVARVRGRPEEAAAAVAAAWRRVNADDAAPTRRERP